MDAPALYFNFERFQFEIHQEERGVGRMEIRTLLPAPQAAPAPRLSGADIELVMARMFAPPSVDPGQMPMNVATRIDSGEMRLALAVLEDALRCTLRHHDSRVVEQQRAAREAMAWLQSDDDAPPFTFVCICQLFDLDPDWIRVTVQRGLHRTRGHANPDARTQRAA
jgi:hypothetical protein